MPPDAALWRIDGQQWSTLHELMAITAERVDAWGLYEARLRTPQKYARHLPKKSLALPRPDEASKQKDEVITDPAAIAAFFS